jgi:pimeloyl-ACP methyl ester carboxylesterase
MRTILDQLAVLEETVPEIAGHLDPRRIAVVGHSMGGHTAGLLGAQLTEEDGTRVSLNEPRITAGALLAPLDQGGTCLHPAVAARNAHLLAPQLCRNDYPDPGGGGRCGRVAALYCAGADWHADPYFLSPSPKALLTLFGGGICSAACRATMRRKQPTKTPHGWSRRPSSPVLIYAACSTQGMPAGN